MTSMTLGQEAVFALAAKDNTDVDRPVSFSITVTNYAAIYVQVAGNTVHVVSKGVGTGNAVISGHSQDGTALPDLTMEFTVGPVPIPQATHFVAGSVTVKNSDITTPADPGTDTVTGTL
jgi:hypothetical protein